jgi:hypothetical protein
VAGVVSARVARSGEAAIARPVLVDGYAGRGLEVWMIERAALHAATNGAHAASVAASPALDAARRLLEERHWFRQGSGTDARYVRDLSSLPLEL